MLIGCRLVSVWTSEQAVGSQATSTGIDSTVWLLTYRVRQFATEVANYISLVERYGYMRTVKHLNGVASDVIRVVTAGGVAMSTIELIRHLRRSGFGYGEAQCQLALAYRDGLIAPAGWWCSWEHLRSCVDSWVAG